MSKLSIHVLFFIYIHIFLQKLMHVLLLRKLYIKRFLGEKYRYYLCYLFSFDIIIKMIVISRFFFSFAVRPTMSEITSLGAAMAAGSAEGIGVWKLQAEDTQSITNDTFLPSISEDGK